MGQKLVTSLLWQLGGSEESKAGFPIPVHPPPSASQALCSLADTGALLAPDRLAELLALPPCSPEVQSQHGWNAQDSSPCMTVCGSPLTFKRRPTAQTTDSIRGRMGYMSGLHVWEISWPPFQRGTHAVVGVSTTQAPLQAEGYQALLGSDPHSWGLDLGKGVLYHRGQARRYPTGCWTEEMTLSGFPERILVVLDLQCGTLGYALEDGRYLGVAFQGLKGAAFHPAVSAVWGQCEVTIRYRNGLKPQPLSLQQLCRQSVREALGPSRLAGVWSLPLPSAVQSSLLQH
ncbi:UNVERIFIED_CONTAM: hypothetical protein FKN15_021523 [Acipenser sinensis]